MLSDIARRLAYQHSEVRVIHRDVKSANLLLDRGCLGRIGDFGIAKSLNKRERERDGIESSGLPLGKLTLTNVKR